MQKTYLGIGDRCVEYSWTSDYFVVKNGFQLEVRQRIISAKGVGDPQDHYFRGGRKRVIYLPYKRRLTIDCADVKSFSEISSSTAHARYIRTSIGDYIVIITAGSIMIDYIVISEDKIAIVIPGKKEVYIDREDDIVTLYIV